VKLTTLSTTSKNNVMVMQLVMIKQCISEHEVKSLQKYAKVTIKKKQTIYWKECIYSEARQGF
jgi:hypothetical protein